MMDCSVGSSGEELIISEKFIGVGPIVHFTTLLGPMYEGPFSLLERPSEDKAEVKLILDTGDEEDD